MSLLDQLTEEMKRCLKAHESERLSVVRLMISAIKYALVDKPGLTEEGVIAVLMAEAKKRRESIAVYESADKPERVKAEAYELAVIEEYLPRMMSEEEVMTNARQILGSEQFANPGLAIGKVMKELKGRAEGGLVSQVVRQVLNSR